MSAECGGAARGRRARERRAQGLARRLCEGGREPRARRSDGDERHRQAHLDDLPGPQPAHGYLADHSRGAVIRTGRKLYTAGPGLVEKDLKTDGKFERSDDWSSCAYFYLDRPESGLAPIAPAAKRVEGL